MFRIALVAGLAGMLSTAVAAQPIAPPQTAPEPSTVSAAEGAIDLDPDKIICRNVMPPTGTRLTGSRSRQRICMSRGDWEQQAREAQEALRVRDSGICANDGSCRE